VQDDNNLSEQYLERILKARVYDAAVETSLEPARNLSRRLGNRVLFKREDLQPVFSFKIRGAYNKLVQLPPALLKKGVACSSAGNHAQGVALASKKLSCEAWIVMPETTPSIKVKSVRDLGAQVIIHGEGYDEAYSHARLLSEDRGLTFVHPFDDPEVIAGQGTIAMEIVRQHPGPINAVFVPVGGGGLISGIAVFLKALFPATRVIGVQPQDSPAMSEALKAGKPVTLDHVGIFADGVAVRRVGDETFRLCREFVDEIVLVSTDEICAAIRDIFEDTRSVMEPAGALAVAGLKRYLTRNAEKGKTLITINCGANVNFDRLRHIAERAAIGENREALIAVEIAERPGSFRAFCSALGRRNVTEFNYRLGDPQQAKIFVGVELNEGLDEKGRIIQELRTQGYPVTDMSDNEVAKLHLRHMVGGSSPQSVEDERLYRFEFPERPGALMDFLISIGDRWNISLFHYRNHGSDYGRVLAGIQIPEQELDRFHQHTRDLGYPFTEETDNQAYQLFLR